MRGVLMSMVLFSLLAPGCASAFTADGFVRVQGSHFALSSDLGRTFKVKGFNYYPQRHPWAIFSEWDPAEVQAELAIASGLNSNTVRTFIAGGSHPGQATVNAVVEFVQICKANKQKAIISLFDGYNAYPAAGTAEEANNFAQIDALCAALKDDTGVFAWDIKNEPDWISDYYWSWSLPGAEAEGARRIDWLYRMRNRLKLKDPNHLVTVGLIFNYNNYLPASTRTLESFVDFVCYHYYPRNYPTETFRQSIQSLKAHTSKPINVEEIGHNADGSAGATEQDQATLFAQWLGDIAAEDISGLVQWTLCDWWDGWAGPINERYYGFLRADGSYSLKPAAHVYRDSFLVEQFVFTDLGRLHGTVRDQSGLPVAGGRVTANPGAHSCAVNAAGKYDFPALPAGQYTVIAEGTGFVPSAPRAVTIVAEGTATEDFVLEGAPSGVPAIQNPGFETGDLTGWASWGQVDGVQSGSWFANISAHGGSCFLGTATNWDCKNGGVYQQVAVTRGRKYTIEVWSRTFRSGVPEGLVGNRLGADPLGGTDPDAVSIVWSPFTESNASWQKLSITVTAARPVLTVFLQHRQPCEGEWHINCFDDAAIYADAASCAAANQTPDGWPVLLASGIVTASFPESFYLEDLSRAAGIRVLSAAAVTGGMRLTVYGTMGTAAGERWVAASGLDSIFSGSAVPDPLILRGSSVGGSVAGGAPDAAGLYNSGLLVTVAGRVTYIGSGIFYIDDGSGARDLSGHEGIRVLIRGITPPVEGSFVTVTGVSTRNVVGGQPAPALRPRNASDIVVR